MSKCIASVINDNYFLVVDYSKEHTSNQLIMSRIEVIESGVLNEDFKLSSSIFTKFTRFVARHKIAGINTIKLAKVKSCRVFKYFNYDSFDYSIVYAPDAFDMHMSENKSIIALKESNDFMASDITEIAVPVLCKRIFKDTFSGFTNVIQIYIPQWTTVDKGAFDYLPRLKSIIIIGDKVTLEDDEENLKSRGITITKLD